MMRAIRKEPGILVLLGYLSVIGVFFLYTIAQSAVELYYTILPVNGSLAATLMVCVTFANPISLIAIGRLWKQHIEKSVRKELEKNKRPLC
jgi:hypothetical protein